LGFVSAIYGKTKLKFSKQTPAAVFVSCPSRPSPERNISRTLVLSLLGKATQDVFVCCVLCLLRVNVLSCAFVFVVHLSNTSCLSNPWPHNASLCLALPRSSKPVRRLSRLPDCCRVVLQCSSKALHQFMPKGTLALALRFVHTPAPLPLHTILSHVLTAATSLFPFTPHSLLPSS
jgi:hypothetical protein